MAAWQTRADRAEQAAIADSGTTDPAGWPVCASSAGEPDTRVSHPWESAAHRAVEDARRDGQEPDPQRWAAVLAAHDRVAARMAARGSLDRDHVGPAGMPVDAEGNVLTTRGRRPQ